jgi:phosphoglycolate phosphatase
MAKIVCNGIIFPNIKAIFFDKDGTLEDSRFFLQELAQERVEQIAITYPNIKDNLLLALGISHQEIDPKGLMAVGSRQDNELAAAAYIASSGCGWFAAREIARNAFENAGKKVQPSKKNSPIFTDSLEVIENLATANLKLGIISADSTVGIQTFMERENISTYFQLALGSNLNLSKPNPLLYLKACKILNVRPQNTLMVGDSLGDIQMAQQANARGTIGISWNNPTAKHLDTATVTIDNLKELKII